MLYQHLQFEFTASCSCKTLLLPATICLVELLALSYAAPLNKTLNLKEIVVDHHVLDVSNKTLLKLVQDTLPSKYAVIDRQTKRPHHDPQHNILSTANLLEHHSKDLKFISHKPQNHHVSNRLEFNFEVYKSHWIC